jgi:hypothetical protein
MLNRAISSPTLAPSRWADWRRGLSDHQAAMVRRYVLVVIVLSALGCIYLWQLNVITDLRAETSAMRRKTVEVEGTNAVLMEQLAQMQSPARIEQAAQAAGWQGVETPLYVEVPLVPEAQVGTTQIIASAQIVR